MFHIVTVTLLAFLTSEVHSQQTEGFDPTCQNHFTQGYGYRLFFNLPPSSFLKDGSVQFNFSLSGPSDGHVLLSERPNTYPAYEIVIGAGGNEFSEIRKYVNSKLEVKTSQLTEKILSADEIRNFSIGINQSLVAVSKVKNQAFSTFMSWRDPSPLDVKYLSFCAWTGVTVNWFYDCKGSAPVAEALSTVAKLKKKILTNYDPYSVPVQDGSKLLIDTTIGLHYIKLDAKKSLLTTHGKFNFTWQDYRIKWNPEEFDNITSLTLLHRVIWLPEFTVFNSFDSRSPPMGKSVMKVTHAGVVTWSPSAEILSWCPLHLEEWPFDGQLCNISLGLYSHPESIYVSLSKVMPEMSLKNLEWKVISLTGETTNVVNPWELERTEYDSENHRAFTLTIILKRQSEMYVWSFFVPVIGSVMFIAGSFWTPLLSAQRLFLHSTSFILLMLNLLSLYEALPAHPNSTPHIISVSSGLLLLTSVHIIFVSCLMSYLKLFNRPPPVFLARFVSNPSVQKFFCLFGNDQGVLEDTDDDKLIPRELNSSVVFGVMLDRILFCLTMMYMSILFVF